MHRETSKFKQSALTLALPVSSIGIRDNNTIYMTRKDQIEGPHF